MPTKTISLELDAYEKLKRAKISPSESFSSVVRRGQFGNSPITASEMIDYLDRLKEDRPNCFLSEDELNRLDSIQDNPSTTPLKWES